MTESLLTPDERQMVEDTPPEFFPRWIDVVPDPQQKAQLKLNYLKLRADHDDGGGIPAGLDIMLRRITYLDRIAQRLEAGRERILQQVERRNRPMKEQLQWHKQLREHEEAYERITGQMVKMLRQIGIEGQARKEQRRGSRRRRAFPVDGVVLSNERE